FLSIQASADSPQLRKRHISYRNQQTLIRLTLPVNTCAGPRVYNTRTFNRRSAMNAGAIQQAADRTPERGRPSTTQLATAKPSTAKIWLKAIELTARIEAEPTRLFADIVDDWAEKQPDHPALISDGETLSYRALFARINQYARWAVAAGVGKGDTVCLI